MRVLKASAGSGKTFNLAGTYIRLLMESEDRYAYRHILAVTFTNKATSEMKSRILRDLGKLAETDEKARRILTDILHDYSAFAVSTIDKFFQQALKAFSREIGQFSSYQIELDKDSLVTEAMDRILDGLTEDQKELIGWLKASVMDRIEQGQRFSIDDGLLEMGRLLKTDEYRTLKEKYGIQDADAFTKERLGTLRTVARGIISDFHDRVKEEAEAVKGTISNAKALGYLEPYLAGFRQWEEVPEPKKTLAKACPDSAFMDCFGEPYRRYMTARQLDKLIFSLGLAGEFHKEFEALLKEKNVMSLDDSNTILRDIIDGSDAPFVYEKLGVRYEHFLLDEFQDTSSIQWDNFLPLLKESESNARENLIVGDVKQSIYRWRDSDWRLLGKEVAREFPDAEIRPLDSNWRSAKNVVGFNNDFFTFAAAKLGTEDIYSDVRQEVRSEDAQEGHVRVSFTDDQGAMVLESIRDARDAGAQWSDIAILVRNKKEGAATASLLIDNGIPVISDDSLSLKSSVVVRRLTSLLSFIENPRNAVGGFLAASMNIEYPSSYHSLVDLCESLLRSLEAYDPESFEGETLFIQAFMDDLQEWVGVNGNNLLFYLRHWEDSNPYIGSPENDSSVRILTIHKSKGLEFPYVIFPYAEKVTLFKDGVHWCHLGKDALGNAGEGLYPVNLSSGSLGTMFSGDYEAERKMQAVDNINVFYVALTRAGKVLHVITKEPSKTFRAALDKGTQTYGNFGELLYEFCTKSQDFRLGEMYDFNRMERKIDGEKDLDFPASYPSVPVGDRLKPSDDAMDFFGEDGQTGAAASARLNGIALHKILSEIDSIDGLRAAVDRAVLDGILDVAQGEEAFELLSARIDSHPEWFFLRGAERGAETASASLRPHHSATRNGPPSYSAEGGMGFSTPLSTAGRTTLNEVTLFDADGRECRPDRVVIADGTVTVIDYKFGEERESYRRQVGHYCRLFRQMGYENVLGYVWYIHEDRIIAV